MQTKSPNHRPRVLMMEGANFTAGFVTAYANALSASGKYDLHGVGYREPVGIPVAKSREDVYGKMFYYPQPADSAGGLRAIRRALNALFSSENAPAAMSGESAGLKGRLYRKAMFRDLRSFVRNHLADYDLYHWHCFVPDYLPVLDAIPPTAPLIITLWGSDTYRTWGAAEYARQLRAAHRASLITMATPELADVFLYKFGRDLVSKVRLVSYGTEFVDIVGNFRNQREGFLRSIGVDPSKITVLVGHNASAGNQHQEILKQIALVPEALRARIEIIIPATYTGTSTEYIESLEKTAKQLGLPMHVLAQHLATDDIAILRASTDVLIHVPISDQFSAAMCESLVGGAVLITGAWLPYRKLRAAGVHYHEVFENGDIAAKLSDILARFDQERSQTAANAETVRRMMSWQSLIPQWIKIYDELLTSTRRQISSAAG